LSVGAGVGLDAGANLDAGAGAGAGVGVGTELVHGNDSAFAGASLDAGAGAGAGAGVALMSLVDRATADEDLLQQDESSVQLSSFQVSAQLQLGVTTLFRTFCEEHFEPEAQDRLLYILRATRAFNLWLRNIGRLQNGKQVMRNILYITTSEGYMSGLLESTMSTEDLTAVQSCLNDELVDQVLLEFP